MEDFRLEANKCTCGAFVATNLTHCPICGRFMDADMTKHLAATAYAPVDHKRLRQSQVFQNFKRMLWIAAFMSILINLFTAWGNFAISNWWSLYVISAVIMIEFTIFYPIGKKQYYWKEVFVQLLLSLAYILFIDWFSDMIVSWSLSFVFPIVLGAFTLAISLFTSIRIRSDPGNSLLVLLTVFLFSIGLFLFGVLLFPRLLGDKYLLLPTFISLAISFFSFVFFATYRFRDFVRALFKRFHI